EVAALPIAAGRVVRSARAVLPPPPTPSRLVAHFPRFGSGYRNRARRSGGSRSPPGRGGPPQFPPPPSERSAPSTPGGSWGLLVQALPSEGTGPPPLDGRVLNPQRLI